MSEPRVFALEGTRDYAEAVAERVGVSLSPLEERPFADGEHKVRPLDSVRGADVYVLHSLYTDHVQSVDQKLVRFAFAIATLKDAGAARVTAVAPLLCYTRKDRRTQPRDPVTTRYLARLIESMGADRIVTIDVHNLAAYENAFRIANEHLEATGLFARWFASRLDSTAVTVVSPDAGGMKRAERFRRRLSAVLGRPVRSAFAEKYRALGVVSGDAFIGDVQGAIAIVYDDLIGSGTTMLRAAKAAIAHGALEVHAVATHGLFVGEADQVLADEAIGRVVVADTVPPFRIGAGKTRAKLGVVETAPLVAEAIKRLHADESLVELVDA